MSDDWGWYFTSAEKRTSILRDQLDAVNAAAAAQSSRLSSQLRTLQGSIETRLNALSAAFDAYVELGDIREQLAGFPDTTVIRRDVAVAIDALAHGRQAQRVDDRGETYWLPHAANAVIGLVTGRPDPDAEATAHTLSPQAELFIVAACGALGHGAAVADRLAALLICDDRLNDDQLALWTGAVHGRFGPVLPAVRELWSPAIAQLNSDPAGCLDWCRAQARSRDVESTVNWIAELLGVGFVAGSPSPHQSGARGSSAGVSGAGEPGAGEPGAGDPDVGLRAVVTRLVGQGTDQEAPLLSRARELRQRIENPGRSIRRADDAEAAEPAGRSVAAVVRESVLTATPGSAERAELLSWLAPGLRAAAEAEAATLATLDPISQRVHTADGDVDVTSAGAPSGQVERVRAGIVARYPTSQLVTGIAAGATALFAVLTVVAFAVGSGWAILTVPATVGAAIILLRAERGRRTRRVDAQRVLESLDSQLADAGRTITARIDARETTRTKVTTTLEAIRDATPAAAPTQA